MTNLLVKVLIIELVVIKLLHLVVVLEGFASEVVNGSWDDLAEWQKYALASWFRVQSINATHPLLQVLSNLVIHLELLVEVLELFLVDVTLLHSLHRGWLRGLEEVEEGIHGDHLLDHTSSVGVWRVPEGWS